MMNLELIAELLKEEFATIDFYDPLYNADNNLQFAIDHRLFNIIKENYKVKVVYYEDRQDELGIYHDMFADVWVKVIDTYDLKIEKVCNTYEEIANLIADNIAQGYVGTNRKEEIVSDEVAQQLLQELEDKYSKVA